MLSILCCFLYPFSHLTSLLLETNSTVARLIVCIVVWKIFRNTTVTPSEITCFLLTLLYNLYVSLCRKLLYYHCNTQCHNALLLTMLLFLRIPVMLTLLSSSRYLPSVMILQRPDTSKIYACVFPFSWDHKHGEQITDPDQQYIVDKLLCIWHTISTAAYPILIPLLQLFIFLNIVPAVVLVGGSHTPVCTVLLMTSSTIVISSFLHPCYLPFSITMSFFTLHRLT